MVDGLMNKREGHQNKTCGLLFWKQNPDYKINKLQPLNEQMFKSFL